MREQAGSLGPANVELQQTMREVAAQWCSLADDGEARVTNPLELGVFAT